MISALIAGDTGEPAAAPHLAARKAVMRDIAPVLDLINGYAARGIMLPRTEFELSENIRDFSVIYAGATLVGCGALHFYSPSMGEVRSLAVHPEFRSHGIGRVLVEALAAEAQEYALDAIWAFTYVPDFFARLGFSEVERGELPLKAWKDCLRCPKFQCCDEIAVMKVLRPEHWSEVHAGPPVQPLVQIEGDSVVLLPVVQPRTGA
jgi:amino-acid N-acetyltransferase